MHDSWYEAFFEADKIDCGELEFKVYLSNTDAELVEISNPSSILFEAVAYDSPGGILVDTSFAELAGDHSIQIKALFSDYPYIESNLV